MPHRPLATRLRAIVVVAVLSTLGAGAAFVPSSTAGTPQRVASAKVAKSTITLDVDGCEGCIVTLIQSLPTGHIGFERERTVTDGKAVVTVPRRKTRGVLVIFRAPGFDSAIFTGMRYPGQKIGSTVSLRSLTGKRRGYACWAGTTQRRATIPITVRRVSPDGKRPYVVAWASTTQPWTAPKFLASDGFITGQDVTPCRS